MNTIFLDLATAYIPFIVQCTKATGDKVDPTVDNLIIYEEGGANATFDAGTIAGSPFDPAKVNVKTGLWGVLVDKSALTAGKFYIALWEMTVDGVTTAKVERYFACNASSFKATGFSTHSAADVVTAIETGGSKLDALYDKLPSKTYLTGSDNADGSVGIDLSSITSLLGDVLMEITEDNATLTATGSEQTVYAHVPASNVEIPDTVHLDLTNMAEGDILVLRLYRKVKSGGAYILSDIKTFTGAQAVPGIKVQGEMTLYGWKVTMEQTAGVNRDYDWERISVT